MNILSARIKDFGCIPHAELELNDQGLVYVTGINLDTDAADSNGGGKSTLFKAISWCLYGETVDELRGDAVIRRGAKKAEVEIDLGDTEPEYTVKRTRSKGKPKLELLKKNGNPLEFSKDEIQKHIEKWVGLDFKSFKNSVLYGQGDAARFASPRTRDSERKDMLHRIMSTEILQSCHAIALERRRGLRDKLQKNEHGQERIRDRLEEIDLEGLQENEAAWESAQMARIKICRDEAARLLESAKKQQEAASGVDGFERGLERLEAERDEAAGSEAASAQEIEALTHALDLSREEWSKTNQELIGLKAKGEQITEQIADAELSAGNVVELSEELAQGEIEQRELEEAVAVCDAEIASLEDTLEVNGGEAVAVGDDLASARAEAKRCDDELGRLDGDRCPTCTTPLAEGVAAEYISQLSQDYENCEGLIAKLYVGQAKLIQRIDDVRKALNTARKKTRQLHAGSEVLVERVGGLKVSLTTAKDAAKQLDKLRDELKSSKGRSEVLRVALGELEFVGEERREALEATEGKAKLWLQAECKRVEEMSEVREALAMARAAAESAGELKDLCRREMERLQEATDEENSWGTQLDEARGKHEKHTAQLAVLNEERKRLERDCAHTEFWVRGFGNEGLPSFILDSVVPYITERTNHYLGTLTDGDISMAFYTQRALKSRDGVKDEITIDWDIEGQGRVPPSGGQLRKMEISTDLALMDLVATREGVQLDLVLLDEVLDGLDREGRSRVLELLGELRRRRGSVFVISHESDLAEAFEREIRVTKQGGCATVEVVK